MKMLKSKVLPWWQLSALKMSVFCFGLAAGAYWPEIFSPYVGWLLAVGFVFGIYSFATWLQE